MTLVASITQPHVRLGTFTCNINYINYPNDFEYRWEVFLGDIPFLALDSDCGGFDTQQKAIDDCLTTLFSHIEEEEYENSTGVLIKEIALSHIFDMWDEPMLIPVPAVENRSVSIPEALDYVSEFLKLYDGVEEFLRIKTKHSVMYWQRVGYGCGWRML